jgi:hypothetical protein
MPDNAIAFFILAAIVLGFGAWAGWNFGGRRNEKPAILPDRVWLCDSCKSFNDPTHLACYRCHAPRRADAREIEPDPEFHVDQHLGRSKTSVSWGASSPWLAAEEPLRDAWLSERARASEQALADSEPAPAFWSDPGETAETTTTGEPVAEPATPDDPDDRPLASWNEAPDPPE